MTFSNKNNIETITHDTCVIIKSERQDKSAIQNIVIEAQNLTGEDTQNLKDLSSRFSINRANVETLDESNQKLSFAIVKKDKEMFYEYINQFEFSGQSRPYSKLYFKGNKVEHKVFQRRLIKVFVGK